MNRTTKPWAFALVALGVLALPAARVMAWTAARGEDAGGFVLGTYPWPWSSAGLLAYVAAPTTLLACFLLFMLPGLLLCRPTSGGDVLLWVVQGFSVALLIAALAAQSLTALGLGWTGARFAAVLWLLATALAVWRAGRSAPDSGADPLADPAAKSFFLWTSGALAAAVVVLAPKIHWEHFNGDGAHAFESVRLLFQQVLPFWPREAGAIASFPGVTSFLFTYPGAVFARLLGPIEVAARAPALLYLVPVAAGLLCLVRRAGAVVTGFHVRVTWCGVGIYLVVLGFSATYNAYTADLALPATQDTLLLATFLGFAVAFLDSSAPWMVLFCVLTYVGLPSGPLLMGLWCAAAFVCLRPTPWRALIWSAIALAVALLVGFLLPLLGELAGAPAPGDEYGGAALLDRIRDPVFRDVRRALYWIVPCGIAPAAIFGLVRGHSQVGRICVMVTLSYFAFFYIQPKTALHYYAPAMLLPWVVFWSHDRVKRAQASDRLRWVLPVCLVVALGLSWPAGYRLDRTARIVGATIQETIGGYERSAAEVFAASDLLEEVVPLDWDPAVPQQSFGGSPLVWLRYAHHVASGRTAAEVASPAGVPALMLMPRSDAPPTGARLLRSDATSALYVADEGAWQALRDLRPPTLAGARIFRISKSTLF